MKCSNCGEPIEEGRLFCLNCGQEVQWVPDYDSFGNYVEQERMRKEKTEKAEAEAARKRAAIAAEQRRKKKRRTIIIAVLVLAVLAAAALAVVFKLNTAAKNNNDFDYQMRMADTAFSNGKYEESYEFVQRAISLDSTNIDARLLLAQVCVNLKENDQAVRTLLKVIADHPDHINAYGQLIKLYYNNDETDEIKELLDRCEDENVKKKYAGYISKEPIFSLPSGKYTEEKSIQLYAKDESVIYYTTDGSQPTKESSLYIAPIVLEEGTTMLKAIAVNTKGIVSDVVSNQYTIEFAPPEPPLISPSSGKFTTDMDNRIYIIVPNGYTAYYAFDEKPTKNNPGTLYNEASPVEMREGTHTFYAVLVDKHGKWGYPGSAIYDLSEPE